MGDLALVFDAKAAAGPLHKAVNTGATHKWASRAS